MRKGNSVAIPMQLFPFDKFGQTVIHISSSCRQLCTLTNVNTVQAMSIERCKFL
jgi:hypothetical protein